MKSHILDTVCGVMVFLVRLQGKFEIGSETVNTIIQQSIGWRLTRPCFTM